MNLKETVAKFNSQIRNLDRMKSEFCRNPEKDFTRNRKLSFESTIRSVLFLGGSTLTNEILKINKFSPNAPSSSAFVQQRAKISPEAFSRLFTMVNQSFDKDLRHRGYRLMAVDGSHIHVPTNPQDPDSFVQSKENERPHNEFHLNAMYDVLQGIYVDAVVQKYRTQNEDKAMLEMLHRVAFEKAILLCDRGYESYNNMAHLQQNHWNYILRIKDPGGYGIADGLVLPNCAEYDLPIDLTLTRRKNKETEPLLRNRNRYRYIPGRVNFDYLTKAFKRKDAAQFFTLHFRIVRLQIREGTYVLLVTNLAKEEFPPEELKKLYNMRWGIETSFRNLKYITGMLRFHSRKSESVMQEIFASLILYNMTRFISNCIPIPEKRNRKYTYVVRFSVTANIVKSLLLQDLSPPDAEMLLRKNVTPVRPNRNYSRKPRAKTQIQFMYRIS